MEYLLDAWENQDFLGNPLRVAWQRRKAGFPPEWPWKKGGRGAHILTYMVDHGCKTT